MALIIIFGMLSIAATGGVYYSTGLYQQWYWFWVIPLLLYGFFVLCFGIWLTFLFVVGLFVSSDEDKVYKPSPFAQWIVRHTARVILLLLHTRVHRGGFGKIPAGKPVMLINNHLSVFDEFAIAAYFKGAIVFITKPENFSIPIGGPWMRFAGYLPLKQKDMASGAEVIHTAAKYIKEKHINVCVAPEGTRNKTFPDPVLLPFHGGTFRMAQESGAPIVVMAIQNTNCILKRFPRHFTHIYLDIVGVLEEEQYASLSSREIADKTRSMMEQRFERKNARFYHVKPKEKSEESGKEDK